MTRNEIIRFLALRTLGNFLVLVALYGVAMTFGPALRYEFQYQVIQFRHIRFTIASNGGKPNHRPLLKGEGIVNNASSTVDAVTSSPQPPSFISILSGNQQQILTPIDPLFSILIPKL